MTAKKIIKYLCVFVVAPLIVLCGVFFFGDRKYAFISLALSVVACIPFFISFEKMDTFLSVASYHWIQVSKTETNQTERAIIKFI